MKKIMPFLVLFVLIATLFAVEESERRGWSIDWSMVKEKIKERKIASKKNKPFKTEIHFNNDPHRPVKKLVTLMINDEGETIRQGESIRYTENGKVASQMNYMNNKREGKCFIYHSNGLVWKEQVYQNGKLNGLCKRFDRYGKLSAEYEYKQGMPGIGLKEYTNLEKLRKQPVLKIEKIDLIKTANKYILKFSLDGKGAKRYKQVKYYAGELAEGKYLPENMIVAGKLTGKIGELEIKIPKGYSLNETFNIVAVAKNFDGLLLILQKKVHVGVRGL